MANQYQPRPRTNINPYRERRVPQVQYGQAQRLPVQQVPYRYQQRYQGQYGQRLNAPQYQPPPPQNQQPHYQRRQINEYDGLPMRPGTEGQYILFYSTYCNNSTKFLNDLCKRQDIYEKFQMINISAPNAPKPGFLKYVPTIVVPGIDRPLTGEEVSDWLDAQVTKKETSGEQTEGIQPYLPNEMGMGMGSDYSYLDLEDKNQPMEHSFVFIGRPEEKIRTPDEKDFISSKPPRIQGVDMSNRPPLRQAIQHQAPPAQTHSPIVPQSSGSRTSEKEDINKAYDELLNRRKLEMAQTQRQQAPPNY